MGSSDQVVLCRYSYDPLDRLVSSTPAGQADIQRFYQKNRLATEIQGALRRTVFQHEDLLLAQQRRVDGVTEAMLLATDQQRSVLQLVDKAGTEPIAYSPYGHHPAERGLTSLLGFNGERRDPVTGHYLLGNGYRAYNPVLMRFNSPDSLSPFGEGGLNAYGYVGGDPVGFGDPTGHISSGVLKKLLGIGRIIRKPKKTLLSRLPSRVDELPSSSITIYQGIGRPSTSRAAASSPRLSKTSALQASDEGRPTVTFPHMTKAYRLKKTKEFHDPIKTTVPADFREAEARLGLHYTRKVEVEELVFFHNANPSVNAEMSIVAGSSSYYESIYARDIRNLEIYKAGMLREHAQAIRSAIRKQS
ncbi:RHS repeat-associated core domain-containing protein [Pseudomonas ficuserectae]|uniref:RHS repeat-associated core domain-containing protein n=1 Tax=Pseudomonas ficuserectae TaxID=53410 RepID=UPI00211CC719|nr:RHS repeat-associated core domain-containing protein [Pseudomonas ficuserectae]